MFGKILIVFGIVRSLALCLSIVSIVSMRWAWSKKRYVSGTGGVFEEIKNTHACRGGLGSTTTHDTPISPLRIFLSLYR